MEKDILKIENIRECIEKRNIIWTKHCLNRLRKRNILRLDVKIAIKTGFIIEYYYDDYPYQSCLILGRNTNNKQLHVVCGINDNQVYIITAYEPDSTKWEEDMKTRRKKK